MHTLLATDFFISYPDHLFAQGSELRDRLRDLGARAFVDRVDLVPGDRSKQIEATLRGSRYTVALVGRPPPGASASFYNEAEHLLAVALERERPGHHALVPLILGDLSRADVPLPLQPKWGVRCEHRGDLGEAATALVRLLAPGTVIRGLRERRAGLEKQREAAIERDARKRRAELDKEILAIDLALRDGEPLEAGQKLGRYALKEFLGKGGFAEVWRAIDRGPGRVVALKVLHRAHHADPERVRRFFQGATVMRELAEALPNQVVRVLSDHEEHDERLFYVMEHIPGGDLEAALRGGRIDAAAAWGLVTRVGRTLEQIHARGFVHRDVKPRNILLGERGPMLTDFDLVRDLENTFGTRTQHGLGTLVYTAPEMMDDASRAGPPADVYSLAMVFLFARLGRDPRNAEVRKLGHLLGQLDVDEVTRRALAAGLDDEAERPASVAALLERLDGAPMPSETLGSGTGSAGVAWTPVPESSAAVEPQGVLPRIEPGEHTPGTEMLPETALRPAMVHIPAGEFMMGSPEDEPGRDTDERLHPQRLTRPFWMATTPVTQAQFQAVMGTTPSRGAGRKTRPVDQVNWAEAVAYCNALSAREGRIASWVGNGDRWTCVAEADGYTLPTEAQWEWACRAGTGTPYWSGPMEKALELVAWYRRNSVGQSHSVGETKRPNPWRLHDMHGNVWEWTADWYAPYPKRVSADYAGPESGDHRVVRGGSWLDDAGNVRAASRSWRTPDLQSSHLGFRVVLPVPQSPPPVRR